MSNPALDDLMPEDPQATLAPQTDAECDEYEATMREQDRRTSRDH